MLARVGFVVRKVLDVFFWTLMVGGVAYLLYQSWTR